jgi:creatinine amidohydrolase
MSKFIAAEMNGQAYERSSFDKAIVAVGSTENYGFHLLFGTDKLVSYGICQ